MTPTILLFGAFFLLLLMGTPIYVALGAAAVVTSVWLGDDIEPYVQLAFSSVDSVPVMALPAFILSGAIMSEVGISRRLIDIAEAIAGRYAGGLGLTTILACVFFGAISGSGPATTAAVGMLVIPAMIEAKYPRPYAAAITSSAGGLGVVIPPSIPLVIYGITAGESIAALFLAGVIPGILLAGSLMMANYVLARRAGLPTNANIPGRPTLRVALRRGIWSLLAPVVVLGGIYSGLFTPTEAAVVSVFYALFVGAFIHREFSFDGLSQSMTLTVELCGRVLILLFAATAFGRVMVENQMPEALSALLIGDQADLTLVWLMLIVMLVLLGMFMETLATIMIVTPILLPVFSSLGVDPIHFGIILVVCCEIGFSTPPLGENMFISSSIARTTIEQVSVKAIPFCLVAIMVVILLALFPALTLWLPTLAGYT